jgi:threonine-phosphate decarboxylase
LKCVHKKCPLETMIDLIRKSFASAVECQHGGKFREAAKKTGREPLDFSANINPLGSPPLEEVIMQELKRIGYYPDNNYREFRQAAAQFVGVGPENIVPGNGSSELIRLFSETVLGDGGLALIPRPTFGEYENQSRLVGASIRRVDLKGGLPDVSDADLKEASALFFCNPNNPTGVLLSKAEVAELARRCEQSRTFLLVDEAFIELSDPDQSIAEQAPRREFLFVMRSLTKSFGIPGLRLGFGVTNACLAEIMNRARIPWSISSLASTAATYLLAQDRFLQCSREVIGEELAFLEKSLRGLGLVPLPSRVNFILVDISSSGLGSDRLCEEMAAQGVLIRDCQSFGLGKRFIRVAVRNREENLQLIEALGRALGCRD